ncbi:hypothetical protein WMF18_25760 [Sorangium sp. So ce315]|uniref:hypothetical protein n=1 Tax=Sorangium sp. So ce315 TaxID=3133299 RepID=UPI003F5E7CA5
MFAAPSQSSSSAVSQRSSVGSTSPAHGPYPFPSSPQVLTPLRQAPTFSVSGGPL